MVSSFDIYSKNLIDLRTDLNVINVEKDVQTDGQDWSYKHRRSYDMSETTVFYIAGISFVQKKIENNRFMLGEKYPNLNVVCRSLQSELNRYKFYVSMYHGQ